MIVVLTNLNTTIISFVYILFAIFNPPTKGNLKRNPAPFEQ